MLCCNSSVGSAKFCISRGGHLGQILPCSLLVFYSRALDPTWQLLTWHLKDAHWVVPYCSFYGCVVICGRSFPTGNLSSCVELFPPFPFLLFWLCVSTMGLCVGSHGYVMNIQRCVIKVIQAQTSLLSPLLSDKSGRRMGQTHRHGRGKSRGYDCRFLIEACIYFPFLSSMVKLGMESKA